MTIDTETRTRFFSEIEDQLPDSETFNNWFKNLSIRGEEDDLVEVCLENSTQVRYFRNRFSRVLQTAVHNTFGKQVDLVISSGRGDTETSPSSPESEPSGGNPDPAGNGGVSTENGSTEPSPGTPADSPSRRLPGTAGRPASRASTEEIEQRKNSLKDRLNLHGEFTFDNFIVGPCNELAHSAVMAVRNQPGQAYNPLFLHGDVGLGKTHLLQAFCHAAIDDVPDRNTAFRIQYLPCEQFVNLYLKGLRENRIAEFRERIRNLDVLVIDDVHFLAGKEQSQEEFFHTFNALHNGRSQIVLSSDCPPGEMAEIQRRLMSRFDSGLTIRLKKPSWETAMNVLDRQFKEREVEVSRDILEYLAGNHSESMRTLVGAVQQITAAHRLKSGMELDLGRVQKMFRNNGRRIQKQPPSVDKIKQTTADFFDVSPELLSSDRQDQDVARARHVALYLCRHLTNHSLEEIGAFFGGKNHSTVHYGFKKIKEEMAENRSTRATIEHLKERF